MPRSKTLAMTAETDGRIEEYEFIGDDEEAPHWLHLAPGWKSGSDPWGVITSINGRTVREVMEEVRDIRRCTPTP